MKDTKQADNGAGRSMPPRLQYMKIYFVQKGLSEQDAEAFFRLFQSRKWKTKRGAAIVNWKAFTNEWIWNFQQQRKLTESLSLISFCNLILSGMKSG